MTKIPLLSHPIRLTHLTLVPPPDRPTPWQRFPQSRQPLGTIVAHPIREQFRKRLRNVARPGRGLDQPYPKTGDGSPGHTCADGPLDITVQYPALLPWRPGAARIALPFDTLGRDNRQIPERNPVRLQPDPALRLLGPGICLCLRFRVHPPARLSLVACHSSVWCHHGLARSEGRQVAADRRGSRYSGVSVEGPPRPRNDLDHGCDPGPVLPSDSLDRKPGTGGMAGR